MTLAQSHLRLLSGSKYCLILFLIATLTGCGIFNQTRDKTKGKVLDDVVEQSIDTLEIAKVPEGEIEPIKKEVEVDLPEVDYSAYKKDRYKIDFLIPFSAEDNRYDPNDGSDEKFVNYYAGIKLALEDFEDQGHNFDVNVLDSERSPDVVREKINQGRLNGADIIVGPYSSEGLKLTAEYGKTMNVAVVSPWLASSRITSDNPFYVQLRPSLSSHYFKMIDHINQNFRPDEIVLVGRDVKSDRNRFRYFQNTYSALNDFTNSDEIEEYLINEDSLSYADLAFDDLFMGNNRKAVILPNWDYNDEDFIYSVLRRLNIERGNTEIFVYGMPILFDSDKIDFEFYNNLNLRIVLSEFVDWEDQRVKSFMRKFYDQYGALPTPDAFEGYDMMNFIGSNLIRYGINFHLNLELDKNRYLQTAYDIQKVYEDDDEKFEKIKYLENRHLDLVQYQGDKFSKID